MSIPASPTRHLYDRLVINVVQDGARLHYALPVALQRRGILGTVYTDWFVTSGSREERIARLVGRLLSGLGKRLADRQCLELDGSRVVSDPWLALGIQLAGRQPET